MSNLGHEHDLGVWVGVIGLLTGWGREAWRWLASLRKKADASEIEERRVMIEEFKAFREAYHEDKQEMLEKIAQLEARLEDSEARADGLKSKLSERTLEYKDALKTIEELLVRIAELER
jgi:chromosome segregation ATPase